MRQAFRAGLTLGGVVAVAGMLLFGSQTLRQARLTTADELTSPSPTPIVQNCISPDNCPSPEPTCVPGEGSTCLSSPAPIVEPSPPAAPTDDPNAARGVSGQIQASAASFIAGNLGVTVAVLYESKWVSGARVSIRCTGPGYAESASGTTAPRETWHSDSALGPQPPSSPGAYFWAVLPGNIGNSAARGDRYVCHGSVSYNGLTDMF